MSQPAQVASKAQSFSYVQPTTCLSTPFKPSILLYTGQLFPFTVRGGRHNETHCVMFLCLATRSVHRELLTSMGLAFLLALGRWIGKPKGSLSERGTNFCGMELPETLHAPVRQGKFNQSQLSFKFNAQIPLIFGGVWEIEKISVIIEVWSHSVSKKVLATALIEVAGILNSKPWGHTFFSVAYWDAIPPNKLQMGGAQCFFTSSCLCARLMVWHRRRQSQILSVQFLTNFVSVVSSHTNCTITTEMGIAFRESHSGGFFYCLIEG